jgi:hypothetical protein
MKATRHYKIELNTIIFVEGAEIRLGGETIQILMPSL